MSFINTRFTFDGIDSNDMGVILCHSVNGLLETPMGVKKTIVDEFNEYTNKYYLHHVKRDNKLTFNITIALENEEDRMDYDTRNKLVNWLFQDEYKPFVSYDNPQIVYYCMFTSGQRFDTHMEQGYIQLEMMCDSPNAWSNPIIVDFDLSNLISSQTKNILLNNMSNINKYYFPEKMEIEFTNTTEFTLTNLSDNGNQFKFTGIVKGEKLIINNDGRRIESSDTSKYRFNDFNGNWLRLIYGENNCSVTGGVKIRMTYQYPIGV